MKKRLEKKRGKGSKDIYIVIFVERKNCEGYK